MLRAARYRYEKLRAEKRRCWQKSWTRFWINISGGDFWQFLNIFSGRTKPRCPLSAAAQRGQYAGIGQPRSNPEFDQHKLAEAQDSLTRRGVNTSAGVSIRRPPSITRQGSFPDAPLLSRLLHLCAAGVNGLKKICFLPAETLMLHEMAALFSCIYAEGVPSVDWCLSIVASVKKKGQYI